MYFVGVIAGTFLFDYRGLYSYSFIQNFVVACS